MYCESDDLRSQLWERKAIYPIGEVVGKVPLKVLVTLLVGFPDLGLRSRP